MFQRFPAACTIYLRPSLGSSQITNSDFFIQLAAVNGYLCVGVEVTISQSYFYTDPNPESSHMLDMTVILSLDCHSRYRAHAYYKHPVILAFNRDLIDMPSS